MLEEFAEYFGLAYDQVQQHGSTTVILFHNVTEFIRMTNTLGAILGEPIRVFTRSGYYLIHLNNKEFKRCMT